MKKVVFLSVLSILVTNAMYAQLTKSQEGYLERKIAEAEAKHKKSVEAEKKKERETEQRHEQQRIQHEAQFNRQMNNLNSVTAEDFLNTPQQQTGVKGFQATTYKAEGNLKAPVSTPRKNAKNHQTSNNGGRNNFGTPSYSGNNYSGDRYDFKHAGFGNTQQNRQQVRVPASQIRGKYKPRRTMNQSVVNLQNTTQKPKVKVQGSQQQRNVVQSPQQPRSVQGAEKVHTSQKQQVTGTSVNNKIAWMENGKIVLDTSKPIYRYPQSSSSSDLKPVDTRRIDYATKIHNITVYNLPEEAYNLSDRNNKITSANVRQRSNDTRTEAEQYKKMRQDAMSGFSSFDNRQKWEDIYDFGYHRTVTTSRTVTKKRN